MVINIPHPIVYVTLLYTESKIAQYK